jgi:hypothetical protein
MENNLNSDGLQFYQYQQNKLSPFILTKLTEHKLTAIHDVGNPGSGTDTICGRVKRTSLLLNLTYVYNNFGSLIMFLI